MAAVEEMGEEYLIQLFDKSSEKKIFGLGIK